MSTLADLSVGEFTSEPALSLQVKKHLPDWNFGINITNPMTTTSVETPVIASLAETCVKSLATNYSKHPFPLGSNIPRKRRNEIVARLPLDLDPGLVACFIHDENYWKRRCIETYGASNCPIQNHGLMWKRMFYERHLGNLLEAHNENNQDCANFLQRVRKFQDFVFLLRVRKFPSHMPLDGLLEALPNITTMELNYGTSNFQREYDGDISRMTVQSSASLGRAMSLHRCCITTLTLCNNRIDDDVAVALSNALGGKGGGEVDGEEQIQRGGGGGLEGIDGEAIKTENASVRCNRTLLHLDVSHNRITGRGLRALVDGLGLAERDGCVLATLRAEGNQICREGGRCLGEAIRSNRSLVELSLRRNRLGDDGGRMILEGLMAAAGHGSNQFEEEEENQENILEENEKVEMTATTRKGSSSSVLSVLNLSSNALSSKTAVALAAILAGGRCSSECSNSSQQQLSYVDLSANLLSDGDILRLRDALQMRVGKLVSLDLRHNVAVTESAAAALTQIDGQLRRNQIALNEE